MASDQPQPTRAVLFDLDGTLADTAPDLAATLNALLVEEGRAPLSQAYIQPMVSHGAGALLELGLQVTRASPDFPRLHSRFLALYADYLTQTPRLMPGMADILASLEARGRAWGVVTNKPAAFTEPLLAALGLAERAGCVISGDTTARKKPHPDPLLLACRRLGKAPGQCLYVGDAERDVVAARAARMRILVALFGYLGPADQPTHWQADGLIASPDELLAWLDNDRSPGEATPGS